MHSRHKIQANIIVIITGSPKISRASEIHCGPAKLDFGWPDWPASEKVKHDPCIYIYRIIMMYKLNSGHLPKVLCNFFKKNNEIHNYNTRTKDMFRISHESQTFSSVGAKIWNALSIKIDVNVTLIKFKNSLKVYLLSNSLVINYPK